MASSDEHPTSPAQEGRWKPAGPSPDNPPWAHDGRNDDAEAEREPGDEVGPSEPDAPPRPTDAEGEQHPDVEDDTDELDGDAEHGTALALPGGVVTLPRPPKRTGVFLDAEDLREHVGALLRAFLGGYEVDAWGNFTFTHEGARIFVTVGASPIGPQVGVFSITNLEIELSPPLAGFLLTTNHRLGFGSFSYDAEGHAVWLRHTLLGTTLDGPELQSAVIAVASTAAHFDDIIRDRFGGRAFHDAPADVQRRAKPPEPTEPPPSRPPNASGYL